MTSIVILQSEREALVAMDTLAIDTEHRPSRYTSKAHYLPHLRTIIAGTGYGGFADDWFAEVNKRMVVRDVSVLNRLSPPLLREQWSAFKADYKLPEGATTTVFHIGLAEGGQVIATQFHSAEGFVAMPIEGSVFKPACPRPKPSKEGTTDLEMIQLIVEAQRAHEAGKPAGERVYIGGQIQVLHLTEAGCAYFPLFEFPEYQEERDAVYRAASRSA